MFHYNFSFDKYILFLYKFNYTIQYRKKIRKKSIFGFQNNLKIIDKNYPNGGKKIQIFKIRLMSLSGFKVKSNRKVRGKHCNATILHLAILTLPDGVGLTLHNNMYQYLKITRFNRFLRV